MKKPRANTGGKIAAVRCRGGKFSFRMRLLSTHSSCSDAARSPHPESCPFGCLGLGDCEKVCDFKAISLSPARLPIVERELCKGCAKCATVCPQGVISVIEPKTGVFPLCRRSGEKDYLPTFCLNACSSCGNCVRQCPVQAIDLSTGSPIIDSMKCKQCGLCAQWCPKGCIEFIPYSGILSKANPFLTWKTQNKEQFSCR